MRREKIRQKTVELDLTPLTDLVTGSVAMVIFTLLLGVLNARQTTFTWYQGPKTEMPKQPGGTSGKPASDERQSDGETGDGFGRILVTTKKKYLTFFLCENRLHFMDIEGFIDQLVSALKKNRMAIKEPMVMKIGSMGARKNLITNKNTGEPLELQLALYPIANAKGDDPDEVKTRTSEFGLNHRA
ncbi:MAG: hypothetical protein JXA30_00780 [Deltaproteobacteria bacterium]|nr:hypothetical protein [Deltaproteobacteria bacterium]